MRKAQVWIETVLYTVIGLAIIGIMLSIIKPALDQKRDQLVLTQVEEILDGIDAMVNEVIYVGTGNSRTVEILLKKGKIAIESNADRVVFTMESRHLFSELGKEVKAGKIKILTTEISKKLYNVEMSLDYPNLDITFGGTNTLKELQASSTPYNVIIVNMGVSGSKVNVNFETG